MRNRAALHAILRHIVLICVKLFVHYAVQQHVGALAGLCEDFNSNLPAWMEWAQSRSPLLTPLPSKFNAALPMHKLLLLKVLPIF